jgi:hypothetical protein
VASKNFLHKNHKMWGKSPPKNVEVSATQGSAPDAKGFKKTELRKRRCTIQQAPGWRQRWFSRGAMFSVVPYTRQVLGSELLCVTWLNGRQLSPITGKCGGSE